MFAALVPALACCLMGSVLAQDNHHESRLGLSATKILSMKAEDWAEYYNNKFQGGEAGYDEAHRTYAECMRERNDAKLGRLYKPVQTRVRRYRELCGKFRVDNLFLQQAYAGGGTMYSHAAERGEVDDEQLVEKLIQRYSGLVRSAPGSARRTKLAGLRRRILKQNPSLPENRKKLKEFNMGEQGATSYKDLLHDLDAIEDLLKTERPDVSPPIVDFLIEEGKSFTG